MAPQLSIGTGIRRWVASVAVGFVLAAMWGTSAWAHGDIQDSSPAKGTRVAEPPQEVTLILAEPAAEGSSVEVTDGCDLEVSRAVEIERQILTVGVEGGQPGSWTVDLRSISAVDGHLVKESFSFKVAGKKDCSALADPEAGDGEEEDIAGNQTSSRPPIDNPDQPTGPPILPFLIATIVIVGAAVALRRQRTP